MQYTHWQLGCFHTLCFILFCFVIVSFVAFLSRPFLLSKVPVSMLRTFALPVLTQNPQSSSAKPTSFPSSRLGMRGAGAVLELCWKLLDSVSSFTPVTFIPTSFVCICCDVRSLMLLLSVEGRR